MKCQATLSRIGLEFFASNAARMAGREAHLRCPGGTVVLGSPGDAKAELVEEPSDHFLNVKDPLLPA